MRRPGLDRSWVWTERSKESVGVSDMVLTGQTDNLNFEEVLN